mgnify:CR=1 FL=1
MIHQPMGGAQGQASDIIIAARQIETIRGELCDILSKHTGNERRKTEQDMDRDYWMNASEAERYGIVDYFFGRKIIEACLFICTPCYYNSFKKSNFDTKIIITNHQLTKHKYEHFQGMAHSKY